MNDTPPPGSDVSALMERILFEVKKVVVGQDHFLERVLVAILAQGHLLVEGVPGLAKTLTVKTLATTIRGHFRRIQFTPDLVPADLVGTRVYSQKTGEFSTSLGPVFTNLLLADEIEGTYPLPEAQVDRFMMKVLVGYPSEEEEFVIVERVTGPPISVAAVATTEELSLLQRECRRGYVDPSLMQYAVKLVSATREPERHGVKDMARFLTYGASPRASIALVEGARALAFLRGRRYALPEDVADIASDVLRHRLVLSYEALAEGLSADRIVQRIMQTVPQPARPLQTHVDLQAQS